MVRESNQSTYVEPANQGSDPVAAGQESNQLRPTNTILILSDEHNRDLVGCYGDPFVVTPNLDALAARGVIFRNAYTNSPVCVPARTSLATGLYPHQCGAWDSTSPFDGTLLGWAQQLRDQGHEVVSIGKLHYRSAEDDYGFSRSILPMHVHEGVGWLSSLLREPPPRLTGTEGMAGEIGAGETRYTAYDRRITEEACAWIMNSAVTPRRKPWALFIGLVAPHFPLVAPEVFFDLYRDRTLPPPRHYSERDRPQHPVIEALRRSSNYDDYFDDEKVAIARKSYYGLCSFLDDNIGKILRSLDAAGLTKSTRIIYTTDHGDNMGNRGLWGKSVMYEDSVAVPLIVAGPELPEGVSCDTPVSLIDIHPTMLRFAGASPAADGLQRPGKSLDAFVTKSDPERVVFSEYHDWSSITGMFMIRKADWKLVYYPGYIPQLFNLRNDPHEAQDLADEPGCLAVLTSLVAELRKIVDPELINNRAFAEQRHKIAFYGGPDAILKSDELGYTPAPDAP